MKAALAPEGAYLPKGNVRGWSAKECWETSMQLAVAEHAFRTPKSPLFIRPLWHQYSGRVEAHVTICVLAQALCKTLDPRAKRARLQTQIRTGQLRQRPQLSPKPRPRTPAAILRERARFQIGDILRETTDGRKLALRRVAQPSPEQPRILSAPNLETPERLSPARLL